MAYHSRPLSHCPTLTTLHGRLDLPRLTEVYRLYRDAPVVSISEAQKSYLPDLNWQSTVYNGIDASRYTLKERPGQYLVFVGRISPEKNPLGAIEVAERCGLPLKIAAKVDPADYSYYEDLVRPAIQRSRTVDFIGEVDDAEKDKLLGGALAYLFPIAWPEPFGISMVEAMATGTPVIAINRGSVPEVVEDGKTGFICESLEEMASKVELAKHIDRRRCREVVDTRFSVQVMADRYAAAYLGVIGD